MTPEFRDGSMAKLASGAGASWVDSILDSDGSADGQEAPSQPSFQGLTGISPEQAGELLMKTEPAMYAGGSLDPYRSAVDAWDGRENAIHGGTGVGGFLQGLRDSVRSADSLALRLGADIADLVPTGDTPLPSQEGQGNAAARALRRVAGMIEGERPDSTTFASPAFRTGHGAGNFAGTLGQYALAGSLGGLPAIASLIAAESEDAGIERARADGASTGQAALEALPGTAINTAASIAGGEALGKAIPHVVSKVAPALRTVADRAGNMAARIRNKVSPMTDDELMRSIVGTVKGDVDPAFMRRRLYELIESQKRAHGKPLTRPEKLDFLRASEDYIRSEHPELVRTLSSRGSFFKQRVPTRKFKDWDEVMRDAGIDESSTSHLIKGFRRGQDWTAGVNPWDQRFYTGNLNVANTYGDRLMLADLGEGPKADFIRSMFTPHVMGRARGPAAAKALRDSAKLDWLSRSAEDRAVFDGGSIYNTGYAPNYEVRLYGHETAGLPWRYFMREPGKGISEFEAPPAVISTRYGKGGTLHDYDLSSPGRHLVYQVTGDIR